MKKRKNSFNRKNRIMGFIILIICCFNFAAFFNINLNKENVIQNITGEENTPKPSSNYYDFSYYKNILIDHNLVAGIANLEDFPLLISIIDSDLRSHGITDPDEIAFFKGSVQLDHEIERYDYFYSDTQVQLIAWVRIPELYWDRDTTIRMEYGYSGSPESPNEEDVWNSAYKGVWHLSENPTGTIYDSTYPHINGNPNSGMTAADQVNGKIDGAIDFDGGTYDYIDFNGYDDTQNSITVSFWMNAGANQHMRLIDIFPNDNSWSSDPMGWSIRTESDGDITFSIGSSDYVRDLTTSSPNPENPIYTAGVWVHVACTYDGSTSRIYIDGNQEASRSVSYDIRTNKNIPLRFGKPVEVSTSYTFKGVLDEVHISDIARSDNWIKTEFRNQENPLNYYTIGEEFNLTTDIGVNVGDKYIYEVVEKDLDELEDDFLPKMRAFVNATAWFFVLNETRHMDNYWIADIPFSDKAIYITPTHFYFERSVFQGYTVSSFLSDPAFFDPPYPPIMGISEWYADEYDEPGIELEYGDLQDEGYSYQYWDCKLIDGTATLPGLVGDNEYGEGVLDFLELYDRAVDDDDLKANMTSGYEITNQGTGWDTITAWEKIEILVQYYRDYWVPIAMPQIWPLVVERKPQLLYMNLIENVVSSPEVKGEYTCSNITDINEYSDRWDVTIDKWNYTMNLDDFENENISAIDTIVVPVYKDGADLGVNITVAQMTLMNQSVMPIIVDLNLEFVNWWEDVINHGNTIYEVLYSGPADFDEIEIMGYTYTDVHLDEVNLTYSMTYDNDGMLKSTSFFGDGIYEDYPDPIRKVFYEVSFYVEPTNTDPDIPGYEGGDNDNDGFDKFKGIFDPRVIILLSISVIFGLTFFIIIKKPRGYRR